MSWQLKRVSSLRRQDDWCGLTDAYTYGLGVLAAPCSVLTAGVLAAEARVLHAVPDTMRARLAGGVASDKHTNAP